MLELTQEVFIMASKGQKFNKYNTELKNEILNKYLESKGTPRTLGQ